MFTTKHLDKVLGETGFHKKSIFSPKKNMLSYRLSKMNSQYRGNTIERMIRDYYIGIGKKVVYVGGTKPYDMLVNGRRIEVKSSIAKMSVIGGQVRYSYNFKHICPNNFHKLILVFVSPEGISIRAMNSQEVSKRLGTKTKHKHLYMGQKILGKALVA